MVPCYFLIPLVFPITYFEFLYLWGAYMGIPSLLLLFFALPRFRVVGPVIFIATFFAVWGGRIVSSDLAHQTLEVQELLDRSDAIRRDLRGFQARNRGCAFERSQIAQRLPEKQFIGLIDASTDRDALQETLDAAWVGSGNDPGRGVRAFDFSASATIRRWTGSSR